MRQVLWLRRPYGVCSFRRWKRAVEPVAAVLMLLFAPVFSPLMPYFLSFAAGAMIYVVVEELIPETAEGEHSNWGVLLFAVGFTVMMALDVALG